MELVGELEEVAAVVRPPLKWAGGKPWLVRHIAPLWDSERHRRLVEPLCGELAVTLGLMPEKALLNDIKPHTMNFYQWLKKGLRILSTERSERKARITIVSSVDREAEAEAGTEELAISADRPKTDPEKEDLLGRKDFAQHLARVITEKSAAFGFVVALYGPWGSGKTSLLKFVQYYLRALPARERPVIVNFNPWWFSGQENLTREFFKQLLAVLCEDGKLKRAVSRLGPYADVIGEVPYVGFVGRSLKVSARPPDLSKLKEKAEEALRTSKHKIVVVIDDIDRLMAEEIRQIFRLVKSVADFPYVTYLMAFDSGVVARALEEEQGIRGKEYLEKIVQLSFEVPPAEPTSLAGTLRAGLDRAFRGTPSVLFDLADWNNTFPLLLGFITTPRHALRLASAIAATYPAVKGEVNFTDFVAIETLRLMVPKVYELIRESQAKFTGAVGADVASSDKGPLTKFHNTWIENEDFVSAAQRDDIKRLLKRLFPKLGGVWDQYVYKSEFLVRLRKECRVAAPEIFPVYFRLGLPSSAISRARIRTVLDMAEDFKAFRAELENLLKTKVSGRSELSLFLERAVDLAESVPDTHIPNVVTALLDDRFLVTSDTSYVMGFPVSNQMRLISLVWPLVERLGQESQTFGILRQAISRCSGLASALWLFAILEAQHQPQARLAAGQTTLVTAAHLEDLRKIMLARIAEAAKSSALTACPFLKEVLGFWRKHQSVAAEQWTQQFVASDEGLLTLLCAFTSEGMTSSAMDPVPNPVTIFSLQEFRDAVSDLAPLVGRAQGLAQRGDLSEAQRTAITKFLEAEGSGASSEGLGP
jgi:predicted KAP-like P-loop ATPase